jgi:hypothetical protein
MQCYCAGSLRDDICRLETSRSRGAVEASETRLASNSTPEPASQFQFAHNSFALLSAFRFFADLFARSSQISETEAARSFSTLRDFGVFTQPVSKRELPSSGLMSASAGCGRAVALGYVREVPTA